MQAKAFLALWSVIAFAILKIITFIATRQRHARKSRELGCQPMPFDDLGDSLGISALYQLMKASSELRMLDFVVERMTKVSEREGRLVTTMQHVVLCEKNISTCEPKNIQAILGTQFNDFELGENRVGSFHPLLGDGIFASNGKRWEYSRALLRPQFSRVQISDLNLEETHVQNMMKALSVNAADGWTDITNIQTLFFRLTVDSATEFLFGESIDSQLAALPGYAANKALPAEYDERVFAFAFDKAQWYLSRALRLGKRYWLCHTPYFKKQCKSVHALVDYFVQIALEQNRSPSPSPSPSSKTDPSPSSSSSSPAPKEKYIFLHALAAQTADPVELRSQLVNILLAGRDTTASLLSWLFLLLARHPPAYASLRAAVLADFGTYSSPHDITYATLKSCAPLQHHLAEALRLFPVVPLNSRRAAVDTSLPLGGGPDGKAPVFVPKGMEIEYSVYAMQRRKDLWGEDADAFRPARWEGRKVGWEYLPFNGGPRICIGQQFALTEAGYVVVRLLQRFERLEGAGGDAAVLGGGTRPVKHGLTLTDCPAEGVCVRLREARE